MLPSMAFGSRLRELRTKNSLSVRQLADRMYVSASTVSRWENGGRMPDLGTLTRLATCLGVESSELLDALAGADEDPTVIVVEDEPIILNGSLQTLEETLPGVQIYGFSKASAALDFARVSRVDVAFLDIELGAVSGITLAQQLTRIYRRTNIIFLTAHDAYMDDAWRLHASGFILKPLLPERVREEMAALRYSVRGLTL